MRNKKVISVILSVITLAAVLCSSFVSSASVFYIDGNAAVCPGTTRVYVDEKDYNYAWIDDVSLRDSSTSVVPLVLHPITDYPYSHTASEFVKECNNYAALFNVTDEILQSSILKTIRTAYYTLLASGAIKSDEQTMRAYNESMGIVYPFSQTTMTHMYTTLVYALLKTDIASAVLKQKVEIPRGTSVEGAVVLYLAKVCGMEIPSSVNTIAAFSYLFADQYVLEGSGLPVSKDPTEQEVYYWVRLSAAYKQGYDVPKDTPYLKVTQEQEEYVRYAYYASILTTKYGVHVDPGLLRQAILGGDKDTEIPRLVLKSMLDHGNTKYSADESVNSLFDKARADGFFELKDDFYTDIYDYEVTVSDESTEIWFTAFLVADQLVDGDSSKAKTYINGELVKNTSTSSVKLTGASTRFTVKIEYNDSKRKQTAEYSFTVKKSSSGSQVVGGVNVNINQPIGDIVNSAENSLSDLSDYMQNRTTSPYERDLSNYLNGGTLYDTANGSGGYSSFIETYPTDNNGNVATTSDPLATTQSSTAQAASVLSGVTQAIKDKPEYVATPIGLLAVGASAGYIFFKRRKNEEVIVENENITEVEDVDID